MKGNRVNKMSDKFVVIDGNSLANRAYYAIPMLSNSQGFITNAIYGFYNMLARIMEEEKPEYLAVAFDKGKKVFRHQDYAEYKGTRKGTPDELRAQFPVLKDLLKTMNVATFEIGGYEADDIIGTLVRMGEKEGFENLILTGDRDAFQLISPLTKVLLTRKGISELEIFDEKMLKEKYNLEPAQMIDLKGLMGDTSDNIPGIPGVGEKTALKLMWEYGELENVLAHSEDFKGKKLAQLLKDYQEQAYLSKKLATIVTDVPIDIDLKKCKRSEPNYPAFLELIKELEFKNIIQKFVKKGENESSIPSFLTINNKEALEEYIADIKDELVIYLETKVTRETNRDGSEVSPKVSATKGNGSSNIKIAELGIKISTKEPVLLTWGKEEDLIGYLNILKPYLEDFSVIKILHDLKDALATFNVYDINLKGKFRDTLLMSYLLNPSRSKNDLLSIAGERLAVNSIPEGEGKVPCCLDILDKLGDGLYEELKNLDMINLYEDLELPLANILAKMEKIGIRVDKCILDEMGKEFDTWINKLTKEIYNLAGEEFNINSPKQLGNILFEKLCIAKGKKTKTGYSTSAEVLESLAPEYEVVAKVLYYRQIVKLKGTYIDGLRTLMDTKTSRVHTTFNQAVTATGRLSSTEPNLQNIPIRMEEGRRIRRAFLPSTGKYLLAADYSQIELRVLAHMAKDEVLIEAFKENQDIHTRTASEVFGVPMEAVNKDMRRAAKAVNFGIVYGISDYGLSKDLGISRKEAKQYIEDYFARYKGVKLYIDKVIAEAREKGYVTTLLNRRRYLPDILSRNHNLRSFAERTAMNTPIQGSAADILKLAMLELNKVLEEQQPKTDILLQVHDELILDVPEEKVVEVGKLVNEIMSNAYNLVVPLKVDLKIGLDWYNMKSV